MRAGLINNILVEVFWLVRNLSPLRNKSLRWDLSLYPVPRPTHHTPKTLEGSNLTIINTDAFIRELDFKNYGINWIPSNSAPCFSWTGLSCSVPYHHRLGKRSTYEMQFSPSLDQQRPSFYCSAFSEFCSGCPPSSRKHTHTDFTSLLHWVFSIPIRSLNCDSNWKYPPPVTQPSDFRESSHL